MDKVIKWIIDNKEWVFSGVGISGVTIIIALFKKKSFNQVAGNNSILINGVKGNVTIKKKEK